MKHIAFRNTLPAKIHRVAAATALAVFGLASFAIVLASVAPKAEAAAGVYKTINFQGKVVNTSGINVNDASYTFKFRVYTSASGDTATPCASTCIWEESKSLTTVNGIFQTNLGDVTTLPGSVNFNTDNLYIAVVFNGDTEMTPRIRLTSVPYAFNADMLDGLDSSQLVQLSPSGQQTGTINVSGNITSGAAVNAAAFDSAAGGTPLVLGSANASSITLAKNATLNSGLTLSLQGSNALNLGSTTAAGGIVFNDGTVNNRAVTISTVGLTASYSLNLPSVAPTAGAQCLQTAAGSTINLSFGSCTGTGIFVSLQSGSPGTPDTGNINITGIGIAASFKAGTFDQATAALLNIGITNATSITIAKSGVTTSINGNLNVQDVQVAGGKSIAYVAGAGNFDQSQSTGTFATGTGAVSLNGATTVANDKTFTANGEATFKAATNSATAFRIQNAASTATLFSVDTTAPTNLITNGGFETDTTGWAIKTAAGTITPSQVTNQTPPYGSGAMQVVTSGTLVAGDGVKIPVTVATATTYAMSFWTKVSSGSALTMTFGRADNGSTDTSCTTTTAVTTFWARVSCVFTTTTVSGSPYVYIGFNDTTARTFFIDGVDLEQVSTGAYYKEGKISFGAAAISSPVLVQNSVNSNAALAVVSASGVNGLTIDTTNSALSTSFATTISNTELVNVTSATALRVRNATTGSSLINFDTTVVNNDINGSIENSTTGYAVNGTGSTIAADATANNAYIGATSLKVTTTASATASAGVKYNLSLATMTSATQYTLSFFAKLASGQPAFTTLTAGRAENGSTNTACTLSGATVNANWQRYTCTFTTGTTSGTPYLYIGQSDASVAHIYHLDGIMIEASATANNYREGKIQLNGDIISPTVFRPQSDSTTAFKIQNAAATTNLFIVDSANGRVGVGLGPTVAPAYLLDVAGDINSSGVIRSAAFDTASAVSMLLGGANASSINLGQSTTLNANKNFVYAAGTGTFDQSASSGTFATGTGNVALNGNTTVASGKTLTVNGDTTIKSSSATALTIQNAAGSATLFAFDTTTGNLSLGSGAGRTIAIATPAAGAGSDLTIKGSAAGTGNVNGGNLILSGGAGTGTGVQGLVNLATAAFTASPLQTNSIAAGIVDQYSSIPVTTNVANQTVSIPTPISPVTGRVLYITGANGSQDFTILLGGTSISIAMKQNSTATLIWNGTGWTAAGASSSTDLQSAYNNTLTSAGGAEIVLNGTGGNADGFTIRNNATTPITGGLLEVQSSIGTNLLSVNNNATELAANGGAETLSSFSTDWTAVGAPTITRHTTLTNVATGQASAQVSTTAVANTGIRNSLASSPAVSNTYQVSFTGKLSSGTFSSLDVQYSRDGGTTLTACANYSTNALVTTGWSKVTCTFTTDGTTATNPDLIIRQTDPTARIFWIDNLSVTIITATSTPPNVQIGGGLYGGATTVLTLDRASTAPVAINNSALYGSMYYDTTSGRIQCYEADGWGACGSSPDNYVNLVPEYTGAVLNGTGIGTLTSDFCSNQSTVLQVNLSLCSTGQALNYYKWTSPQATQQTYSIYVSYQLPAAFKQFQGDSTIQLTARTDSTTNGIVSYEMFRSQAGTLSACGTETTVTSIVDTWQTVGINGDELTSCGFSSSSANNFAIFKINVKAKSNANVYVGTLSFTTTGQ